MRPILNLTYGLGRNTVVPHAIARSCVFSSNIFRGVKKRPLILTSAKIPTLGSANISQISGCQLDQSDAEVFYDIVNTYFTSPRCATTCLKVIVERSKLLSRLGRPKGGKTNALLATSLMRLIDSSFILDDGSENVRTFAFLRNSSCTSGTIESGQIQVEMDPRFLELYKTNQWTLLKKSELDALDSPVARGLYAYNRTHNNWPNPLLTDTVKVLVGRSGMQESKWIALLRASLEELRLATGWDVCEVATTGSNAGKIVIVKRASEKRPSSKVLKMPIHQDFTRSEEI